MASNSIDLYLNDHLAGSMGAVELVEHWAATRRATELGNFFQTLGDNIRRDRQTLEQIMEVLGISQSAMRKAAGWLAEKAARLKMGASQTDDMELFQSLESLALGITGKKALWSALKACALPELQSFDFAHLEQRAANQFTEVETHRIEIALKLLR